MKVRISVLESMPSGNLSIEDIAASLNVSKRTFQRKLKAESTNFLEQVSIIREERARYYLVKTDLSCDEISILL